MAKCINAIVFIAETSDTGTVLFAYTGNGTVESAFTVGIFQKEQGAMEKLLRFRQCPSLIVIEHFHI